MPTEEDDDARHRHRTWETVPQDRSRAINRINALLVTMGRRLRLDPTFVSRLEVARRWNGKPIPDGMTQRLTRDWERLTMRDSPLAELERVRTALTPHPKTTTGT